MLDHDAIADIEGDAGAMLAQARIEPDASPSMDLLSLRLIGSKPRRVMMPREGDLHPCGERWILRVHRLAPKDRARWIIGHELAEWWYRRRLFASHAEREAWCDALGACLVAPRPAFRSAIATLGHRVHRLAEAFDVGVVTADRLSEKLTPVAMPSTAFLTGHCLVGSLGDHGTKRRR